MHALHEGQPHEVSSRLQEPLELDCEISSQVAKLLARCREVSGLKWESVHEDVNQGLRLGLPIEALHNRRLLASQTLMRVPRKVPRRAETQQHRGHVRSRCPDPD